MTAATAATLTADQGRLRILDAVKELAKAPFTVQDVVARTGMPPHEVEAGLATVVRDYTSDIDVDEAGNLVYRFPPGLVAREDIVKADAARRRKAAFKQGLIAFFKAWTVAMVIVYFVIYVILLIAFLAALSSRRDNNSSSSSSSRSSSWGGGGSWWWWSSSPWGYGGYGSWANRRERQRWNHEVEDKLRKGQDPYSMDKSEAPKKPSLAERTWFHLFGTDGIKRNPLEQEKELLTYIRAKKGFITNADIIALLGVTYDQADAIGTRLVATYEGEMDLTDDGLAIYRFPNLMLTGAPEVAAQAPQLGYLWQVRQKEHVLRSNPSHVVPALNVVNVFLALLTLGAIIPYFHWGWGARIGLVFFPLAFSLTFFALGLRRKLRDMARAREYERESMRIAIFQLLFKRRTAVKLPGDERNIAAAGLGSWSAGELAAVLPGIADDLRGEVSDNGAQELRVPRVWDEMAAIEKLRAQTNSTRQVGRTVFTTRDGAGISPVGDVAPAGGVAPASDALSREIADLEKELQS